MIKFEAKRVVLLPRSQSDFVSISKVKNAKVVAPNVLLGEDEILYLTDSHMQSELERFGVHPNGREKCVLNGGEEFIKLSEAVYLGSVLDFLHYESVVYTLAKYNVFLNSSYVDFPKSIILNEKMSEHTRIWLISSIHRKFPQCKVILMNKNLVLDIETLFVLTLNDHLLNSYLEDLSAFIRDLTPTGRDPGNFGSKILLARKKQVFFNLRSRKPRNSRLFEFYARLNGYQVFDPGSLKFEDVLQRMASATKVVSYHGGALVNLLACEPGTQVREIYSEWYADCFEQISASCKLDYKSYSYGIKRRPDLLRSVYYLMFNLQNKAYKKHFRIKYRDFRVILQD
jgi:hypothetical protein